MMRYDILVVMKYVSIIKTVYYQIVCKHNNVFCGFKACVHT